MAATTVELRVERAEPDATDLWFGSGAALLALVVAATIARRRSRTPATGPPRRIARLLQPALLFSGAITLWLAGSELSAPSATGPLPLVAALSIAVFLIIGFVLFGILDFWLGLARPRRTGRWLVVAMPAFAGEIALAIAAALVAEGRPAEMLDPRNLTMFVIGAACGLVWWAYLPRTHPDSVRIFE